MTDATLIAAVPYAEGQYPDAVLEKLARALQDRGCAVAGVIQHDLTRRDRSRCDMSLEDLSSGIVIGISEDRGAAARGCRIDQHGLVQAAALIASVLQSSTPRLLIINKFGKIECEGGGLRDVIAEAVSRDIPVVVGVPLRNWDAWTAFAGDFAGRIEADHGALAQWVAQKLQIPALAGDPPRSDTPQANLSRVAK